MRGDLLFTKNHAIERIEGDKERMKMNKQDDNRHTRSTMLRTLPLSVSLNKWMYGSHHSPKFAPLTLRKNIKTLYAFEEKEEKCLT
mgnify:CR=1 FL=1